MFHLDLDYPFIGGELCHPMAGIRRLDTPVQHFQTPLCCPCWFGLRIAVRGVRESESMRDSEGEC